MEFRTIINIPSASFDISPQDRILTIGSCFAENIAQYLQKGRFHVEINPFGILYNPISIAESLTLLWNEKTLSDENFIQQGELWHSFLHHGSFGKLNREDLILSIEKNLTQQRAFAKKTTRLLLTLGTANVFEYKKTQKIVANCHKIPNSEFNKKRLTVTECVDNLAFAIENSKAKNPNLEVILTVSPIRHIRDGIVENQRSKATLLLAAEMLEKQFSFVHYFPAYEIVMDDLRDYRFFNTDMIHPNDVAIDYVWKAFTNCFFNTETNHIYTMIEAYQRAEMHRPLFPESQEYQLFLQQQSAKKRVLEEKFPSLNW
jgi:hypothetical protein